MLLVKTTLGTSAIQGIGLFAAEPILKGTAVWVWADGFDARLSQAVLDKLSAPAREQVLKYAYLDEVNGMYELMADDARFFNHSDSPNTAEKDGAYVATNDIPKGAEITCDYRVFDPAWKTKLEQPSE